jgi:hypothetical protein
MHARVRNGVWKVHGNAQHWPLRTRKKSERKFDVLHVVMATATLMTEKELTTRETLH